MPTGEQLLGLPREPHECSRERFSILPQRQETDAEEFERDTLVKYSERLALGGCQLVTRRHGGGGAPSGRARGSAPVHFPRTGIVTTPLIQPLTE